MASALWLVVLSGVSVARASTLLRPRSHFPTTTLKHFGPQRFSMNVTGCPLVLLSARDLTRIHQNQRVSTSVHVAGAVVLFDWDDMPTNSFEWLYVDLEHVIEFREVRLGSNNHVSVEPKQREATIVELNLRQPCLWSKSREHCRRTN